MKTPTNPKKFIISFLVVILMSFQGISQPWTAPTGHTAGGQWTFFTAKAQIDGVDMVAGDQLAIFDGAKLVGAFTLTQACNEVNMYGNQWIAYEKLDDNGSAVQGYTPGNAYTFKAWKASTNTVYANYSLSWNTLVGNGHEHSVFPPTNTYTWDYPELSFFSAPGSIDGYVKELGGANPPIEGASVTIVESGQQTTTDPAGYYQFPTVVAGTYNLAYAAAGYGNDTVTGVTVASNGSTTVADVLLTSPPGSISGVVSNSDGPIEGASVTTNPGGYSTTTDEDGIYELENIPAGTYNVTASADYHDSDTESVVVVSEENSVQDFELDKANGALKVTVKDGSTGDPIAGATVNISPGGSQTTGASGIVTFSNLASGTYDIEVSEASYVTANSTASVNDGYLTSSNIFMVSTLPTYPADYNNFPGGNPNEDVWTIYIREAYIGSDPLVAYDAIAVYDGSTLVGVGYLSDEAVPANQFSNFISVFTELNDGSDGYEPGNQYTIEAYRYADDLLYSASVTLSDPYSSGAYVGSTFPYGDNVFSFASLNLGVTPGDISGTVTDDDSPANPIEGATVKAVDQSTTDEFTTTTDVDGEYILSNLPPGTYDLTASAVGFTSDEILGVVVVNAGSTPGQDFALDAEGTQIQNIPLVFGYQFVSTRMITADMDMEEMVSSGVLDDLKFVKNSAGHFFHKVGPDWVNNIGDWVVTEGYLFNMDDENTLNIEGHPVPQHTPIPLNPGYQFIAYLPDVALNAQYALGSILDDMEYARNSAGAYLRKIGGSWVNNIGTMKPGEGYLVKMKPLKSSAYTLTYPAAELATITTLDATGITLEGGTIGGNISAHGNAAITERGVYWGTDPDPITNGTQVSLGTGTGSFSHDLVDLNYDVTYYFAAYAVNVAGEAHGDIKSFVPDEGPVVNNTKTKSYMTFADAISHADPDDNLELIDDLTEATVTINKPLSIDFSDFTLTGDVEIYNAGPGTVNLTGNADGITEWDVTGTLTVNSPGTTVNNSAEFQGASPSIYITDVGVFTEDGNGNWIEVDGTAEGVSIVVGPNGSVQIDIEADAVVASIVIDENATGVVVNNEGTVESIENRADGTEINNDGTIEELENTGEGVEYTGTLPDQTTGGPPNGYVLNENTGFLFNSIQDAIGAAVLNDVLIAGAGTYTGNLEINVSGLTLRSFVQYEAIIQTVAGFNHGSGYGGITILADNVTLEGFKIEQDVAQAVIHTHNSNNAIIKYNAVVGLDNATPRGIDVGYASANSDGVVIEGNTFDDLYCGVYVNRATNLLVDANTFEDMGDGAIVFDGTWYYSDINVIGNTAIDANYLQYFYGTQGPVTQSNNTLINTLLNNLDIYNTTQGTSHATIQDAVDNATANDVIDIAAGTYTGHFEIDRNLTLRGAQFGVDANGRTGNETLIQGTFKLQAPASDITIDGFSFQAHGAWPNVFELGAPYNAAIFGESSTLNISNNISNHATDGTSNTNPGLVWVTSDYLTFTNNLISQNMDIDANAVYLTSNVEATITGNTFTGAAGFGAGANSEIALENNTVLDSRDEGFWFWPVDATAVLIIKTNTVTDYDATSSGSAALKVVDKPASINGETNKTEMEDSITIENPGIDTVLLDW